MLKAAISRDWRSKLRIRRGPTFRTAVAVPQTGRQQAFPPATVLESRDAIRRTIGRGGMSVAYAARDLRSGHVERLRFGIARTFQPPQRVTMIGTDAYAPPKRYRGFAEPRGDIYAYTTGTVATLHHIATGRPRAEPPFSFQQRRASQPQ